MAVTYDTAMKTARMNANKTYFINGTIELQTAASVVAAIFTLTGTAGSVTGAVWTLTPLVASTVTAGGSGPYTVTKAVVKNSGGTASITGLTVTATGGGGDIILDNNVINSSQSVTLNTATITHA